MSPIISVRSVGKRYVLEHRSSWCPPVAWLSRLRNRSQGLNKLDREEFWPLRDISFTVQPGERLGIIGRNGAGKSTLLKILSRILAPTTGEVRIQGRIASLLEVGTGFHPDLTGRENIFLNGALLGMRREEIRRKFDAIVDFAEVEKFLDTPVKHYSSGMYVRLAFAIAAHLETEVLIADEVLAVGDIRFQNKCLEAMGNVSKAGRTVLFVSHNMAAVRQLCSRALFLEGGGIALDAQTDEVIAAYYAQAGESSETVSPLTPPEQALAKFTAITLEDQQGKVRSSFSIGEDVVVRFCLEVSPQLHRRPIKLAVQLRTSDGIALCNMADTHSHFRLQYANATQTLCVRIQDVRLYPGIYHLSLWAGAPDGTLVYHHAPNCAHLIVADGGQLAMHGLSRDDGLLFLTPDWEKI